MTVYRIKPTILIIALLLLWIAHPALAVSAIALLAAFTALGLVVVLINKLLCRVDVRQ